MTHAASRLLETPIDRRALLRLGLGAGAGLFASMMARPALASLLSQPERTLSLVNLHTGERCRLTYWQDGGYVTEALATIQHVLRDHRTNAEHPIDTALLDLLSTLRAKLETNTAFEVISGYRSPESNAAMHARSSGVARGSLHMQGKAIDIRVGGRALADIHRTALAMGMGGVGYYPSSDFVHVDTGRVRQWQGA